MFIGDFIGVVDKSLLVFRDIIMEEKISRK